VKLVSTAHSVYRYFGRMTDVQKANFAKGLIVESFPLSALLASATHDYYFRSHNLLMEQCMKSFRFRTHVSLVGMSLQHNCFTAVDPVRIALRSGFFSVC